MDHNPTAPSRYFVQTRSICNPPISVLHEGCEVCCIGAVPSVEIANTRGSCIILVTIQLFCTDLFFFGASHEKPRLLEGGGFLGSMTCVTGWPNGPEVPIHNKQKDR